MGSNPTPRTKYQPTAVLGNYVNYLLSKKALKHSTIKRKVRALKSILKNAVDLADADAVVKFLNECNWSNGSKDITINAYRDYLAVSRFHKVSKAESMEFKSKFLEKLSSSCLADPLPTRLGDLGLV